MNVNLTKNIPKQSNVVLFSNNSVYNAISFFVEEKNSYNTRKNYILWIKAFFKTLLDKDINYLSWNDIINITHQDMRTYRKFLKTINGNNTVNQKMACIASLWGELKKHVHGENINLNVVKLTPLIIEESSWGSLTEKEINQLLEFCKTRDYKPFVQEIYFKTLFITGIRSNAIMQLKQTDIIHKSDLQSGKDIWCLYVKDKRKYVTKAISDSLYSSLVKCFESPSKKVFNVCDKILRATLKDFCLTYNLHNDRQIVLHSLKKSSMDYVWDTTKNIIKTAKQGGHNSIEMTYQHYVGRNDSLASQPSYELFDRKYSIEDLKHLSKDELLNLIDKSSGIILRQLIYNMNHIGEKGI